MTVAINEAAILGEVVPQDLDDPVTVRCLIRGIRCHDGFASHLRGATKIMSIVRALNARDIMSNRVPVMKDAEEVPYCFWHPDVPSEETLRQLLAQNRNEAMRYQVGRACAAGGYTALYEELGLLPDVAIAEEARDNMINGREIFNLIMGAPIRYAVMDDYTRTIRETPTLGAFLNGDTCIRSAMIEKQPLGGKVHKPYFDIAEDWNLGIEGDMIALQPIEDDVITLLYSPLPADLPAINKDFLILMTAWSGNIDRYIRLRRPMMIRGERQCIVRGIHWDTFFSKWCYQQPELRNLRKFCYARCIMNNALSWANDQVPETDLPYFIWYPKVACEETYVELAYRCSSMAQASTHALIIADGGDAFEYMEPIPTYDLYEAAKSHYAEYISKRMEELGIDLYDRITVADYSFPPVDPDTMMLVYEMREQEICGSRADLYKEITMDHIGDQYEDYFNTSFLKHMGNVLLYVSTYPQKLIPDCGQVMDLTRAYGYAAWVEDEEGRKMLGVHPNPNRLEFIHSLGRGDRYSRRPRGGRGRASGSRGGVGRGG